MKKYILIAVILLFIDQHGTKGQPANQNIPLPQNNPANAVQPPPPQAQPQHQYQARLIPLAIDPPDVSEDLIARQRNAAQSIAIAVEVAEWRTLFNLQDDLQVNQALTHLIEIFGTHQDKYKKDVEASFMTGRTYESFLVTKSACDGWREHVYCIGNKGTGYDLNTCIPCNPQNGWWASWLWNSDTKGLCTCFVKKEDMPIAVLGFLLFGMISVFGWISYVIYFIFLPRIKEEEELK